VTVEEGRLKAEETEIWYEQ